MQSRRWNVEIKMLAKYLQALASGMYHESCGISSPGVNCLRNRYLGKTCFILGNGPSLAEIDTKVLEQFPTFGTNGIFLKYIPDFYVTVSVDFYKNHMDTIRGLAGTHKFLASSLSDLLTCSTNESVLNCQWPLYGRFFGHEVPVPLRFSYRPDRVVFLGGTVLFVCLQLAFFFGFQRVLLLGVDHKFGFPRAEAAYGGRRVESTDGIVDVHHFDARYSKPGYTPHCDMLATERSFQLAMRVFNRAGRTILNLTEGTGLPTVPKGDIKDVIRNA